MVYKIHNGRSNGRSFVLWLIAFVKSADFFNYCKIQYFIFLEVRCEKGTFYSFFSFFLFSFISCVNDSSSTDMPDNPEPQPQSSPETKDSNVVVKNNAQYDVNIYVDKSPYYDILPNFTVKAGASHSCKLPVLEDTVETVFYIEYIIDIGNAKFTYRTLETQGYKNLLIKENEQATFTIALDKTGGDETTSEVTYEESTVVGGWEVGPKANTVAVQTATLLGGELYTLVVSGPSYDDISCAYKGGNDNPEHAKMSID